MATVLPFKGIIPNKNFADRILTYSADNYTLQEVKKIVQENNLSYLNVIYPDFIDGQKTSPHSLERFHKIYQRFNYLKQNDYFIQDRTPVYYISKQKHPDFEFNGIIAAVSVEDYLRGNIKIHEQTLSEREEKLKEYLKHCKINGEPVLFFYEKKQLLQDIITEVQAQNPEIIVLMDNVTHILWKCSEIEINKNIQKSFTEMNNIFIGDGHHRSASSVLLSKEWQDKNKSIHHFLGAFFQEDNLKVYSFHRLLKNIDIPENFIEKVSEYFEVRQIFDKQYLLDTHIIGLYWNKKRYLLKYRESDDALDTQILYQYIFKSIFAVQDIRNNTFIDYFPAYTCSISKAEKMVDGGEYKIAFFTHAVSVDIIKTVSLHHQTMPPKSTYILPKLLNALVIYSLENSL